jgi:hypothetical protein
MQATHWVTERNLGDKNSKEAFVYLLVQVARKAGSRSNTELLTLMASHPTYWLKAVGEN